MTSSRKLCIGLAAVAFSATAALADVAPSGAVDDVAPRGARVHDGFYLRLGTGFGAYHETVRADGADESTLVTGISSTLELAVGWAVRPGFVLGLGYFSSHALASDRTVRGQMPPIEVSTSNGEVSLIGPFLDWYFDSRRGLHFQLAAGVAVAEGYGLQTTDFDGEASAVGGGVMLGFGHDWWVSSEWSFGILARVEIIGAVGDDDAGESWTHTFGALPSLLFTATFN